MSLFPSACARSLVALLVAGIWLVSGCSDNRAALHEYVANEHPRLTAETPELVQRFESIATSADEPAEKARRLDQQVIVPYRALVARLQAHQPDNEMVSRHHRTYAAAAQRQLEAFEAARDALAVGRSLEAVGGMLRVSRRDMERWLEAVRQDAQAQGITLLGP